MSEASGLRSLKTGAMPASRYLYGRPKCLLTEVPLVLPIELAWTLIPDLERRARRIEFLCEHLLTRCVKPKLFLKLERTHGCEAAEVLVEG